MIRDKKLRYYFFSFLFFGLLFFLVATFSQTPSVSNLNLYLLHHIYNFSHGAFLPLFARLTRIGSTTFCFIITVPIMVYLGLSKKYPAWIMVPLSILGSDYINSWLKAIYKHPRPNVPHLVVAHNYSFPSGHSMNMMAFYGFLIFLLLENAKGRLARLVIGSLGILVILLVGISRIYLGVHYPIDVFGGYSMGLAWLSVVLAIYTILKRGKKSPKAPSN